MWYQRKITQCNTLNRIFSNSQLNQLKSDSHLPKKFALFTKPFINDKKMLFISP